MFVPWMLSPITRQLNRGQSAAWLGLFRGERAGIRNASAISESRNAGVVIRRVKTQGARNCRLAQELGAPRRHRIYGLIARGLCIVQ